MLKKLSLEFLDRVGTIQPITLVEDVAFQLPGGLGGALQAFAGNSPNVDIYARPHNPTVQTLASTLNNLEDGKGAVLYASGQAATDNIIRLLASQNTEVILSQSVFGGTVALHGLYARSGITFKYADPTDPDSFKNLVNDKTRLFLIESAANPNGAIAEFDGIADVAREHNIPFVVDNTTTPLIFHPFDYGADIVTYSMTKFLNGHGNAIGGAIIDSGKFLWKDDVRFPVLSASTGGSPSLAERFNELALFKALQSQLTVGGAILSPGSAATIYNNLATLPERLVHHIENTQKVAEFLNNHPAVEKVHHSGLPGNANNERLKKYIPTGTPGPIMVTLKGGFEAAEKFIGRVDKVFHHAVNIGDANVTLISHPSTTTHRQLTQEQKIANGIEDGSLRLSIAAVDFKKIIETLEYGLGA